MSGWAGSMVGGRGEGEGKKDILGGGGVIWGREGVIGWGGD